MLHKLELIPRNLKQLTLSITMVVTSGCGTMTVDETHYYAVPSDLGVNVYRLKVTGQSHFSDAKYQSGFYPTTAVDSIFGNIRSNGGADYIQAQKDLETETRNAILKSVKHYYTVALNPESSSSDIDKAMELRQRVVKMPPLNSTTIEYNPALGVAIRNADEKMVFILSANPDAVVGNIRNFAESEKTSLAITELAKLNTNNLRNEVISSKAVDTADKTALKILKSKLTKTATKLTNLSAKGSYSQDDKKDLLFELNNILKYMNGVQQ